MTFQALHGFSSASMMKSPKRVFSASKTWCFVRGGSIDSSALDRVSDGSDFESSPRPSFCPWEGTSQLPVLRSLEALVSEAWFFLEKGYVQEACHPKALWGWIWLCAITITTASGRKTGQKSRRWRLRKRVCGLQRHLGCHKWGSGCPEPTCSLPTLTNGKGASLCPLGFNRLQFRVEL